MKILIVDDHEYNRDLLSFILEDEGHECVEAVDGLKACAAYKNDPGIELILMDINMPEMDGVTATRAIKQEDQERFVPIIFVTALDDGDMISKCLDAGGDDFVPKPVNENVLLAKINAHARTRSLYNNLQNANEQLLVHKQMMDREHSIVERVFEKGANRIKTRCNNVKKYTSPMSMFNGDLVLEAPSPSGGLYNLVGDFTGHGLASAIGSLPVSEIFFSLAETQASVAQIASALNNRLVDLLPSNMFFCAALTFLDSTGKNLTLWSGGMNDILMVSATNSDKVERILARHMPMGILLSEEFDDSPQLLELDHGTRLFIYTDGINEAVNSSGEEFGFDRLDKIILDGGDVIENITQSVHDFQEGAGQSDDLSIIELALSPLVHVDAESGEVVNLHDRFHHTECFPWEFSMRLENEALGNTSIVDQLMGFVGSIQGIELHQDKIFTIVSELYSNALEHGVLGLDSALKSSADGFEEYYRLRQENLNNVAGHYIDVNFCYIKDEKNSVKLVITDSGKGFDYKNIMGTAATDEDEGDESHGRGVYLLSSLCSTLEYSNEGRTVTAVYDLLAH